MRSSGLLSVNGLSSDVISFFGLGGEDKHISSWTFFMACMDEGGENRHGMEGSRLPRLKVEGIRSDWPWDWRCYNIHSKNTHSHSLFLNCSNFSFNLLCCLLRIFQSTFHINNFKPLNHHPAKPPKSYYIHKTPNPLRYPDSVSASSSSSPPKHKSPSTLCLLPVHNTKHHLLPARPPAEACALPNANSWSKTPHNPWPPTSGASSVPKSLHMNNPDCHTTHSSVEESDTCLTSLGLLFLNLLYGTASVVWKSSETRAKNHKLTANEEELLQKWILSPGDRGGAPRPSTVREIANLLLAAHESTPVQTVGEKWV